MVFSDKYPLKNGNGGRKARPDPARMDKKDLLGEAVKLTAYSLDEPES